MSYLKRPRLPHAQFVPFYSHKRTVIQLPLFVRRSCSAGRSSLLPATIIKVDDLLIRSPVETLGARLIRSSI